MVPICAELLAPCKLLELEIALVLFNLTKGVLPEPEVPAIVTLPTAALLLPEMMLVPAPVNSVAPV